MYVILKYVAGYQALVFNDRNLFGDIFQLADVAIPRLVHQILLAVVGEFE